MKKAIFFLILSWTCHISFAQNKEAAEKLVSEGIAFHDKGDYNSAIAKYNEALQLDKDNLFALAEIAYSLVHLEKYTEAIKYCETAIQLHPGEKDLKLVYLTSGNAWDGLKMPEKSIEMYDEGIKLFPGFYQYYFNKGVTLSNVNRLDEAQTCFEKAVMLNPKHASSHNAIARIAQLNEKRIPALLAYCRFLALEPQSDRATENLARLQSLMKSNVEKTGNKSITISIGAEMLNDSTVGGKPVAINFTSTELFLALETAKDFDKKNKKKSEVEQFVRKFNAVCISLSATRQANHGFFWDYYVPYFTEMKDKDLLTTFGYIAFASSDSPKIANWLKSNKSETDKFFEWSKSFVWEKEK